MNIHDSGYKRLFSNRTIFRQLVETFVEEPWVHDLDFARAERVDKSYVSEHYKETESDILYRVPIVQPDGSKGEIYVYVLLEFQSTVPRFMAVRVLHYLSSIYLDLVQQRALSSRKRLPAILPIVLYNGEGRWTAPERLAELVADYPPLNEYAVDFGYLKLVENEFTLGRLLGIRNIISTLFLVEAHYDLNLLSTELLALYDEETDREALNLFVNWFQQLALHGRVDEREYGSLARAIEDKEEVRSMLVKAIQREKQEAFEQGIEQGIEQHRVNTIRAMHRYGIEMATIADVMSLTIEQVTELLDNDNASD